MKNRPNFVPKNFKYQPVKYKLIGHNWTAIFQTNSGKEIHLEIKSAWWKNPEWVTLIGFKILL